MEGHGTSAKLAKTSIFIRCINKPTKMASKEIQMDYLN